MKALLNLYQTFTGYLSHLTDIPLLFIRLVLAYGFWGPDMMKVKNIGNVAEWFDGLGIPFPTFNAYLSAFTEVGGAVLLTTRTWNKID